MALFGNYQGRDTIRPVKDANGVLQRTNSALEISDGDTPAQKWLVDNRLPVTFTYGFAYGVNQMVMSKGLVVAVDPIRFQKDFETGKLHSVLTIANGGKDVKLDVDGKTWVALAGAEETAYAALTDDQKDADLAKRPANNPIGVLFGNVYKKVDDALNGMAPTVITEKYIKLPLFADATHALQNPWGSAYGAIKPGEFVKSDENGRFVKWVEGTDLLSQRVGQVLAIQKDLVPEGAAQWASWALQDKLNSDYFNPYEWPAANNDKGYPGYPFDKAFGYNELDKKNPRLPIELDIKRGIPGLTDGANVAKTVITDQVVDEIPVGLSSYPNPRYCRTLDRGTPVSGIQIAIRATVSGTAHTSAYVPVESATAKDAVKINVGATDVALGHLDYVDALAGLLILVIDEAAVMATAGLTKVEVLVQYTKAGLAGVPTMLDWDGVVGEIRVLVDK